ncbi:MAG: universal stress protein [archaeon]
MVRKILVPIDGFELTERVIETACDLSKTFGAPMTLLHVVVLPVTTEPGFPIDPTPLEETGRKILQSASEISNRKGCKADAIIKTDVGNAGHRIVRTAKEGNFDLIVIGARSMSRIETLILGSVSRTVTHSAPCPVLVIH